MKNQLYALCLMFFTFLTVTASKNVNKLVIEFKDGEIISYALSDEPEVSIVDKSIVVSSTKLSNIFERESIKEFRFEKTSTSIDEIKDDGIKIIKMDDSEMVISSNRSCMYEIFDVQGRKVQSIVKNGPGVVHLDISSFNKGIYVIRINENKTIKFLKK